MLRDVAVFACGMASGVIAVVFGLGWLTWACMKPTATEKQPEIVLHAVERHRASLN